MSQPIIAAVDAAGNDNVARPLPRLVAFACDAVRYAESLSDADARTLALAPWSGLSRGDASALIVAAGRRATLIETIGADRVPLDLARRSAAHGFVAALTELERAFRAQGATLGEVLDACAHAFALEQSGVRARATLDAMRAAARAFDARSEEVWNVTAAIRALSAVATSAPQPGERLALQPLPRREFEAGSDVKRRKTHYSASSLAAYAECERKWYYRYVCASVEDKGSSASMYGSAFHWALERFHQRYARADSAPPSTLADELDRWVQTAFERYRSGFDTAIELDLQTRRARRTARRYVEWFVARGSAHPFTVIGTETEARLQLDGYDFIGYIDRLDRDDATGALTVVDYKTGTISTTAADYRKKVADFVDFQLPFYYWAQTALGERVSRLSLIPLKDALLDVLPVELEVVPLSAPPGRNGDYSVTGTIGIDELERARAKMIQLARHLAEEPIEAFAVARDPDACTWCAYRIACRNRPLQRDDRFGR
jgi:RecB family exonuclease